MVLSPLLNFSTVLLKQNQKCFSIIIAEVNLLYGQYALIFLIFTLKVTLLFFAAGVES